MLLFGHPEIENEKLYHVNSLEAIKHTPSNSTLLFTYDKEVFELIEHAQSNGIAFGIDVSTLTEVILAENLGAKYILVKKGLASSAQKAADTYIFDAKILTHITEEKEIEELAIEGVDGAIFSEAIIKIS